MVESGGSSFYTEKRFDGNIDVVFVAPCPGHPYFKERIGSRLKIYHSIALNSKKEDVITVKLHVLISVFGRQDKAWTLS